LSGEGYYWIDKLQFPKLSLFLPFSHFQLKYLFNYQCTFHFLWPHSSSDSSQLHVWCNYVIWNNHLYSRIISISTKYFTPPFMDMKKKIPFQKLSFQVFFFFIIVSLLCPYPLMWIWNKCKNIYANFFKIHLILCNCIFK
jgi:hypothetical protein